MKPVANRITGTESDSGRRPHWNAASDEGRTSAESRWIPPAIPHRRYPSLSEDFETTSPSLHPMATKPSIPTDISRETDRSRITYVRAFVLLVIIAIIATLLVSA